MPYRRFLTLAKSPPYKVVFERLLRDLKADEPLARTADAK